LARPLLFHRCCVNKTNPKQRQLGANTHKNALECMDYRKLLIEAGYDDTNNRPADALKETGPSFSRFG